MNRSFRFFFLKDAVDQNTFRLLYFRNKMYFLPLCVIFIAFLLLFFAIIPQVQDYFSLRNEETSIKERIAIITNNNALLSGINESELDSDLQIAVSALPVEKDFVGILRVIGQAAADSNVVLGDFSFQIGQLSSLETKVTKSFPIEVTLTINNSGIDGVRRFLQQLTRKLPLSETVNIQTKGLSSTLSVIFYYKPFIDSASNQNSNIKILSKEEKSILWELSLYK